MGTDRDDEFTDDEDFAASDDVSVDDLTDSEELDLADDDDFDDGDDDYYSDDDDYDDLEDASDDEIDFVVACMPMTVSGRRRHWTSSSPMTSTNSSCSCDGSPVMLGQSPWCPSTTSSS